MIATRFGRNHHLMRLRVALLLLVCCWRAAESASTEEAKPESCFRVFDATGFLGKPDLSTYGLEPITIIYGVHKWWPARKGMEHLPPRALVRRSNRDLLLSYGKSPSIAIIDIEHWPTKGSDLEVAESLDKYMTVLVWMKEDLPGTRVGYYGLPPLPDYWRATKPNSTPEYRSWQAENDRFKPLADAADVVAPSLYTFYADINGWEKYATENVREARRLASGKPVYAFVWPHYHDSSSLKLYLPGEYWLRQLRTLERIVDGVVIWSGPEPWNPKAEWWQVTKSFLANRKSSCSNNTPKAPVLQVTGEPVGQAR